jgi:four helix bundle protein
LEKLRNFWDLVVWKKSHQLVLDVYKITREFPSDEKFGLTSQLRRAAISVSANIAEGFRKRTRKDKPNYYNIAHGSLEEVKYYLILAKDLRYLRNLKKEWEIADEVSRMLMALQKSLSS